MHKFLTKEQTYSQLLQAVSENEKKLDSLRKENEQKKEALHFLRIDNSNKLKDNKTSTVITPPEIVELTNEISFLEKELESLEDRKKKIHLVSD